jgi:DNA-binding NarL/FixJ family response regulator
MKTILMVEDEGMLSDLFSEYVLMLPDMRYLGCCSDGTLALKQILESHPDIIVQDIRLPGVNGLELLIEIRKHLPGTKVLVFSGSLDAHTVKMALDGDAHAFVEKAYGLTELNKAIMEVVSGKRYYSKGAQAFVTKLQSLGIDDADLKA